MRKVLNLRNSVLNYMGIKNKIKGIPPEPLTIIMKS